MMRLVCPIGAMAAGLLVAGIHVPSSVALAAAESKPQPEYNPLARQLKITGDVAVELHITAKGEVESVKALSGSVLLAGPVVKTLKTWKFKPFLQDGTPAEATTVMRFSFK